MQDSQRLEPERHLIPDLDIIRTKLHSLEDAHIQLVNRQREAELFATNAPDGAYFRACHAKIRAN